MAKARGWWSRLFGGDRTPDVRRILEAYGACLERRRGPDAAYRHERDLPYSKEEIGRAILAALKFADRRETREPLARGFVALEQFLPAAEWELIDEHDRLAAVGGLAAGMSDERQQSVARLRIEIEERRARRAQLLEIIEQERSR
jgi:hypothetical protein